MVRKFLLLLVILISISLSPGCLWRQDGGRRESQNRSGDISQSFERRSSREPGKSSSPPAASVPGEVEHLTPPASVETPSPTQDSSSDNKIVVLDPGHGNPGNPGPRGPSGLKEADVNLDIGLRLRQFLESAGIKVLMTRDGPTTPLGNPERAELANQNNASLFFRIHSDSSRDPTEGGTRTLWYKPDSERAARIVQGAVVRELGLKDLGIKKQFLVGFQYAQVPAVLVEVAYISNPSEEKLLAEPAFRQRAAKGMYDGIREYLEEINNLR